MIPRHVLPFSVGNLFSIAMKPAMRTTASDLEKTYADALGVTEVVSLPSVRAGIRMTILAGARPEGITVGPAYTCDTVHEALALSGSYVRLIDSAPDSFLMSPETVGAVTKPGCSLILSEVYGISYDPAAIEKMSVTRPGLRIFDLAMCIPSPERMTQLGPKDVALFSFGWGKPMYAGWGGVACFRDPMLADRVREIRDQLLVISSTGFRFRRSYALFQDVVMNQRLIYGLTHQRCLYRILRERIARTQAQGYQRKASGGPAAQWTRPMTMMNWKVALYNLRHIAESADLRRSQAEVYSHMLVEPGEVRGPRLNALPQSHFPMRVPAAFRDDICDYLRRRGIDTGTLFPFPIGLHRDDYPHAARAADEVVTLPLGPAITTTEVHMIAQRVKDGLKVLGIKSI